uniref:Uncharacterized protein n=1 Tax=Knipowitschia caucasica TaxID=637954 RepID=A0AAV2MA58_KNICA
MRPPPHHNPPSWVLCPNRERYNGPLREGQRRRKERRGTSWRRGGDDGCVAVSTAGIEGHSRPRSERASRLGRSGVGGGVHRMEGERRGALGEKDTKARREKSQ